MNETELQQHLDAFDKDPKAMMNRVPEKRDAEGQLIKTVESPFAKDLTDNHFVLHRDEVRRKFSKMVDGVVLSLEDVLPGRALFEDNDRAEDLVDALKYTKASDIDAAGLSKAALAETPWSDDYWAIYLGILGKRYADPKFPSSEDWEENYDYVRAHPLQTIAASGDSKAIDLLSPSEKYDLLVGDLAGALTSAMWSEGKAYHDQNGTVETWMGICHGWAPASYMLPRPRRVVTATAADGHTKIRFYPSDLKALASLLWANAGTVSKFIGSRSNDKNPATDENGRNTSPRVFDTNPGTWHLSIVNQIGAGKRSFVMDATYDYEVWNQPVYAYECKYFNPQTMKFAKDLKTAMVTRGEFTKDRFAKYRGESAASFIGVAMRAKYIVETKPSHADANAPKQDAVQTVDYYYDLELDAAGKIVGGEWYQNRHPDFLWTPPKGARAVSPADATATGAWSLSAAMPTSYRRAAHRASSSGLPLAKIVEQLLKAANG